VAAFHLPIQFKSAENESAPDLKKVQSRLAKMTRTWLWQSGLGAVLNVHPAITGSQLVVVFADGKKVPMNCLEQGETILAMMDEADIAEVHPSLTANSAVQIWMANGWYNASACILSHDETSEWFRKTSPEQFFGKFGASLRDPHEDSQMRLMELRKVSACTGANGPGQYAWVWAAASLFFFFSWVTKRK
jgi:hypothetical protein